MRRAEAWIVKWIGFLRSRLGKATLGLAGGVICFCWPAAVAFPAGAVCLYYAIHQFRPVASWIYHDIRQDLADRDRPSDSPFTP